MGRPKQKVLQTPLVSVGCLLAVSQVVFIQPGKSGPAFPIEDSSQNTPQKRMWIPQLIAVVMLLIALNPSNPYGYYTFLRFVCCAVFAYLAFLAFEQKKHLFAWLLVVTAIVYNPIIRVQLTRDIWTVVNMVTIIIAIVAAIFLKREMSS